MLLQNTPIVNNKVQTRQFQTRREQIKLSSFVETAQKAVEMFIYMRLREKSTFLPHLFYVYLYMYIYIMRTLSRFLLNKQRKKNIRSKSNSVTWSTLSLHIYIEYMSFTFFSLGKQPSRAILRSGGLPPRSTGFFKL